MSQECVAQFLEDYYDLLDPEGVENRMQENRAVDEAYRDQSIYVAGHLFTYDRRQFWKIIFGLSEEIEEELQEASRNFLQRNLAGPTDANAAAMLYYCQGSGWQEEYSAEDGLTLRRLFRKVADSALVDWD